MTSFDIEAVVKKKFQHDNVIVRHSLADRVGLMAEGLLLQLWELLQDDTVYVNAALESGFVEL